VRSLTFSGSFFFLFSRIFLLSLFIFLFFIFPFSPERGFKEPCYLHFSPEAAGGDRKRIGSEGASHACLPDPEDDALEEIVVQVLSPEEALEDILVQEIVVQGGLKRP
jgi:hypothetical protein